MPGRRVGHEVPRGDRASPERAPGRALGRAGNERRGNRPRTGRLVAVARPRAPAHLSVVAAAEGIDALIAKVRAAGRRAEELGRMRRAGLLDPLTADPAEPSPSLSPKGGSHSDEQREEGRRSLDNMRRIRAEKRLRGDAPSIRHFRPGRVGDRNARRQLRAGLHRRAAGAHLGPQQGAGVRHAVGLRHRPRLP